MRQQDKEKLREHCSSFQQLLVTSVSPGAEEKNANVRKCGINPDIFSRWRAVHTGFKVVRPDTVLSCARERSGLTFGRISSQKG